MRTTLILFTLAFILRLAVVAWWQFDGLYGQDAFAYYQQAEAIYHSPFISPESGSQRNFFWPNGYPLLIAGGMFLVGVTPWAGQITNILMGAMLAPLMYSLTQTLFAGNAPPATLTRAGILAGLIVTLTNQLLTSSVVIMADMAALFWAVLAVWLLVQAVRVHHSTKSQAHWLLLTCLFMFMGVTFALAVITRWIYLLLAPALGGYILLQFRRDKQFTWLVSLALVSATLIIMPQIWLSLHRPGSLVHSWLIGWRPYHFFQRDFTTLDGTAHYRYPMGLFYAFPTLHPTYLFPLLTPFIAWAVWRLWQSQQYATLTLLLGWAGGVYLFLAGIPYQNMRFGLTLYPPCVILASFGVSDLLQYSKNLTPTLSYISPYGNNGEGAKSRLTLTFIIIISLMGMAGWSYRELNITLTNFNQSKEIAQQVNQILPPNATLLTFGLTLTMQHYHPNHPTLDLYFYNEAYLTELLNHETQPLYLLLDISNIETQWQSKPLAQSYHWLQRKTHLTPIATYPPYTLFQVTP